MATKQQQLNWTSVVPSPSTSTPVTISIPGATSIVSVTTVPALPSSAIKITPNLANGTVSVTLSPAPSTGSRRESTSYPLVDSSYDSSTGRWSCTYGNGETVTTSLACATSRGTVITVYDFIYNLTIEYETNNSPTIILATTDSRTLYENDTFNLTGTYNDADAGNVISVKYSVNNGAARALTSAISDGSPKTFNRVLAYKNNKLYDGQNVLTDNLAEGAQHVVKVWAEDDQGGKSSEQLRIFYVVANRAPLLTVNAFPATPDLLNTGTVKFGGTVSDPDGNAVKVEYKIRNGSFTEVYSGTGGTFEITVPLSSLNAGTNAISIRAVDSYGATTTRNLNVTKAGSSVPLKTGDKRYRITPPNGSAQGLLLWVQRESGDLTVSAEISMTAAGEDENFVPMTLNSTAFVNGTVEEDEFAFEGTEAKTNIVIRLKMTRTNPASTAGIILVNGVLS